MQKKNWTKKKSIFGPKLYFFPNSMEKYPSYFGYFSIFNLKKITFYTEILIRKVEVWIFLLVSLMKKRLKTTFSHQNFSIEKKLFFHVSGHSASSANEALRTGCSFEPEVNQQASMSIPLVSSNLNQSMILVALYSLKMSDFFDFFVYKLVKIFKKKSNWTS